MYKLLVTAALLLVLPFEVFAAGTVIDTSFYSPAMGQEKSVQVYLPEGYQPHGGGRYPVIYYLHGAGILLGHNEFPVLVEVLDEMIGASLIKPVIVVRPDGFSSPYPASFYTSSVLYGDLETYMTTDLINWVDSSFRTIPSRMKRVVMGHSMGGYGALMFYGKHPDLYCGAAGVCASGLDLTAMLAINIYGVLAELGTGPPYYYNPAAGFANGVLFSMSGAFSPNLMNPPYYVDLPLDEYANIVPEVWALWMEHNIPQYLEGFSHPSWRNRCRIYFDAGTQDQFYILPASSAFACSLDAMGINYEFQVFEGGHFDKLYQRFPIALDYLCSAMNHKMGSPTGGDGAPPPAIGTVIGSHGPVSDGRAITFELLTPGYVTVAIFDCTGRLVSTPAGAEMDAGQQRVALNETSMSSGVYFYSIRSGGEAVTGKVLMLR